MDVILSPCKLSGITDDIIASKSLAHRAFICAAFADKPTQIECNSSSEDIVATTGVLRSIGAQIVKDGDIYTVTPVKALPQDEIEIDFGESGSTMRFILPILCALGIKAKMITHSRLTTRPLSPLYEELVSHGARLSEQGKCPLYCSGKLSGNEYTINGGVSSQFISGLMFALAVSGGGNIRIQGKLESASYVALTVDILKKFGVEVTGKDGLFTVKAQRLISPSYIRIEGDWSNAAFFLAAGALSEKGVTVHPLCADSIQGDRAIADILKKFGAQVYFNENSLTVRHKELSAIEIDASDIPDLVPIISVVAAAANGKTVIKNIARLRFKESDRVETVCEMLGNLGVHTQADENTMTIYGSLLRGGVVDSHNDHRIAMSAAIASCVSDGPVTVKDAGAVRKSYPDFFEKIVVLGAKPQKRSDI